MTDTAKAELGVDQEGSTARTEARPSDLLVPFECDVCDGCGWTEGGPTLQTTCTKCGGSGIRDREVGFTRPESPHV